MRFNPLLALLGTSIAIAPLTSFADIHKCVGANGAVSYSDKPCVVQNGEKAVDIKGSSALASVLSKENDLRLGKACWRLSRRESNCRTTIAPALETIIKDNCAAPMDRFEQSNKSQYRNGKYYEAEPDPEYANRYERRSSEEMKCGSLQEDMWDLAKNNFASKISAKDKSAIEYAIAAVPSTGNELKPTLEKRKRP